MPLGTDGEELLQRWVEAAASKGIRFHLHFDGPAFNLLADDRPHEGDTDIPHKIAGVLGDLLLILPKTIVPRLFSTLRLTEYRIGSMVQSVYLITSSGIESRDRTIPWVMPAQPAVGPPRIRALWLGAAAALLLIASVASVLVIDYRALWRSATSPYFRVVPEDYDLDALSVASYVALEKKQADATGRNLEVEVRRTPRFPVNLSAYRREEAAVAEEGDARTWLALQKLYVEGKVTVEYLDSNGSVLFTEERSLRKLLSSDVVLMHLPVKAHAGTRTVRFTY